jgi:hypothetical protein
VIIYTVYEPCSAWTVSRRKEEEEGLLELLLVVSMLRGQEVKTMTARINTSTEHFS